MSFTPKFFAREIIISPQKKINPVGFDISIITEKNLYDLNDRKVSIHWLLIHYFQWLKEKYNPPNKKILLNRRYDEPVSIYSRFVGMTI